MAITETRLDRLYNLRDAAMARGDATAYNDFQKLIDYEHRDHHFGLLF